MKNMKRVQYHLRVNAEGHSEKHNGSNYIKQSIAIDTKGKWTFIYSAKNYHDFGKT